MLLKYDYKKELENLEKRAIDFMQDSISKGYFVRFYDNIVENKTTESGWEYKKILARVIEKRIITQAQNTMAFYYGVIFRSKFFENAYSEKYLNDEKYKNEKYITIDRAVFNWLVRLGKLNETVLTVAFPDKFIYCGMGNLWNKCVTDIHVNKKLANLKLGFSVMVNNRDICLIHESMFTPLDTNTWS